MASTASSATAGHPPAGTRRDFLYIATAMVGAVGAAAILVPLVDQMNPDASETTPVASWLGGYFCPCHGSKYDPAGRVFSGVPAPYNLPVPPYRFVNDNTLRIGENDASATAWNFDSIRQL